MRWPSPASEAMVSLPMMESSATVKPMRMPAEHDRQRGRHQHVAEQLIIRGAHGTRGDHEHLIDIAEPGDGVERDRKEADGGPERDLGGGTEPEEQDVERKEKNDRDRIDAGEQRLEYRMR